MQAYIQNLQSAGARVVPLLMTDEKAVTEEKLANLNGVLFPGGANNYHEIAGEIYANLIEKNDAGEFYPLWGTCLGMEAMARLASDSGNPLGDLVSKDQSLTLDFLVEDPKC